MDITHAVLCIAILASLATAGWFYAEAASLREDFSAAMADYENLSDIAESFREAAYSAATPLQDKLDGFCQDYLERGRQIQDLQVELAKAVADLAEEKYKHIETREEMCRVIDQAIGAKKELGKLQADLGQAVLPS